MIKLIYQQLECRKGYLRREADACTKGENTVTERFETFTILIARLSRSVKRIKAEQMAEFQLKGPHVSCLYYLSKQDGLTSAELCERADEDKAAISRSLDFLEKNGYIVCGCADGKRYKAPLRLTEKGRETACGVAARIDSIVGAASAGLSSEERTVMYRALTRISGNLERFLSADAEKENAL